MPFWSIQVFSDNAELDSTFSYEKKNMDVYKPLFFLSMVPNREQKVVHGFPQLTVDEVLHTATSFLSSDTTIVVFPVLHRITFSFRVVVQSLCHSSCMLLSKCLIWLISSSLYSHYMLYTSYQQWSGRKKSSLLRFILFIISHRSPPR